MTADAATPGLAARLGLALAAPRRMGALVARGVGTMDGVALLAVTAALATLPALVRAVLAAGALGGGALGAAVGSLIAAAGAPVLVRLAVGVVMIGAAGLRRPGLAFDLGGVAWVPYLAVRLLGAAALGAGALIGLSPRGAVIVLRASDALGLALAAIWALRLVRALRAGAFEDGAHEDPRGASGGVRAAVLGLAAAVVVLAGVRAAFVVRHLDDLRPLRVGAAAPTFTLPRADGAGDEALSAHVGKVVVVDFWATWCGPCRATMPILARVADKLAARGVVVLSVNVEGARKAGAALAMARTLGVDGPILVDDGSLQATYRVGALPTLILIDRAGRVRGAHVGVEDPASYERQLTGDLEALLAE